MLKLEAIDELLPVFRLTAFFLIRDLP